MTTESCLYSHTFKEEKMADCGKEFAQFLEKIQLGKTKIEHLRTSRDALRDKIKAYYKEKGENVPDFLGQAVMGFDKKDTQEKWRSLFGEDFPKYAGKEDENNPPNIIITGGRKPWGN
jgi:hypothetical protein